MKTIEKFYRKIAEYLAKRVKPQTIQFTISVSFTIVSVCSMGILGVTLYNRFVNRMEDMTIESSEQLLNQTAINLETYLRNMRRISDAMYYSVIKDKDLAVDSVDEEMNLLYEANKDNLISIACYTNDGKLVAAAPVTNEKDNSDIVDQEWFVNAVDQMENLHFSTPHVQNLFDNATYRYYWVVSLSRAVELTSNGNSTLGVLLVDMNYSSIEQLFNKANTDNSSEYVYLMDSDGEIIYHPKQKLIYTNLYEENNLEAVHYDDGSHQEIFQGEKRLITVKTVSYTGWKIVSVVPMSAFNMGLYGTRMFVIMLMALSMLMIIIINQLVSARIAKPLQRLNESVKEWEAGNLNPTIYVGGSLEVEHLGKTLRSTVEQINQLMHDILYEQEEKYKGIRQWATSGVRLAENQIKTEKIEAKIPKSKIEDMMVIVEHYKSVEKQVRDDEYKIARLEDTIDGLQNDISNLNSEKKILQSNIRSLKDNIEIQKKDLEKAAEEIDERKSINDAFTALKKNDEEGILKDIAEDLKLTYGQMKRSENMEMNAELGEIYREMLKRVFKSLEKKGIRMD